MEEIYIYICVRENTILVGEHGKVVSMTDGA